MKSKILVLLICILIGLGYFKRAEINTAIVQLNLKTEVNDDAKESPYKSRLIDKKNDTLMPKEYLASGITYDWDRKEYVLVSDHPHKLFAEKASTLITLDKEVTNKLYSAKIESDSDLEGIAYIGKNRSYSISEKGNIYVLKRNELGEWELASTLKGTNGVSKKVASLAFDKDNEVLYTAEKEQEKKLYKMDLDGNILEIIKLKLEGNSADIDKDFTISGMAYADKRLLILSEAYSTIFIYDTEVDEIIDSVGLDNTREVSGIALSDKSAITIGDQEDYIPEPVISKFSKMEIVK